jgi:hypothetical protein
MSLIFHFPENDPGGFGGPVYLSGACPPGSLIGKKP